VPQVINMRAAHGNTDASKTYWYISVFVICVSSLLELITVHKLLLGSSLQVWLLNAAPSVEPPHIYCTYCQLYHSLWTSASHRVY